MGKLNLVKSRGIVRYPICFEGHKITGKAYPYNSPTAKAYWQTAANWKQSPTAKAYPYNSHTKSFFCVQLKT